GVRLGFNATLLLTVAAEMVTGRDGLGGVVWLAWETMRTDQLYASLVLIIVLGVGFNVALQAFARLLVPWQVERQR
ncbi:MAG: ABC transporter permease, partial [Chloroflexota bacterium]|nr:ABC transporter permease [Chloroflexota bacterium]